jgi:sodium ion-translocating decarboxylase beta subunit
MFESITSFFQLTGFNLITWQMFVMWFVVLVLFYLAIYKKFEPLLLVPIAFGALVANLPTRGMITFQAQPNGSLESGAIRMEASVEEDEQPAQEGANVYKVHKVEGGLFDFIAQGIKLEIFPPLIFLGVGALTDFGPLIANPRMLLLGAAAQVGVFFTFLGASFLGFSTLQSASIGIIGGADGPTAIFTSNKLAPELLGPIAVAAYSYMASGASHPTAHHAIADFGQGAQDTHEISAQSEPELRSWRFRLS